MRWAAGGRGRCRDGRGAPATGRAQPDFPSPLSHLEITRESFCAPATFFLFCSVLVLYMFSMAQVLLVQQPDTISPAQAQDVRGLAALRLLESLKKSNICSRAGPAPCGV